MEVSMSGDYDKTGAGHMKGQSDWINIVKFIAMIAVLIDHVQGYLYYSDTVRLLSWYSVSLFVLVAGIVSYRSMQRWKAQEENKGKIGGIKYYLKRTRSLIVAYVIAVIVYRIILTGGLNVDRFVYWLLHFNVTAPHYYVFLYLQLMVVCEPLYMFLSSISDNAKGKMIQIVSMMAVALLSFFCSEHTNIMGMYGGAGKIFGGTYLLLFYFGMVLEHNHLLPDRTNSRARTIILFVLSGACLGVLIEGMVRMGDLFLDLRFPLFGTPVNPPGFTLMLYSTAILLFLLCASVFDKTGMVLSDNR